jgi:hypothetical protein
MRRRVIFVGLSLVIGFGVGWFIGEWRHAPRPADARLIEAIERRCGPAAAPGLEAAARLWTRTCPRARMRVGAWEFRLRLDAFDPPPAESDVRVVQFLDFTENDRVETGWPNGSFFDWRVLARPVGAIARLRARLQR